MKYKLLCIAILSAAAVSLPASGASEQKVVVSGAGGDITKINIADIKRITFDGTEMKVTTENGEKQFDVREIENITFDLSTSASEEITATLNDLTVQVYGGSLSVTGPAGARLDVKVFNIKGVVVAASAGQNAVTIDFSTMPSGVYIVKANDKVIKLVR